MAAKRRGLGRGIGALIPTSSPGSRPTDVFFPPREDAANDPVTSAGDEATPGGAAAGKSATVEAAANSAQAVGATGAASGDQAAVDGAVPARLADTDVSGTDGTVGRSTQGAAAGAARNAAGSAGPGKVGPDGVAGDRSDGSSAVADGASAETADDDGEGLLPVPGASFAEIPVTAIRANAQQPRTVFDDDDLAELTASIAEVGVLQPVVVRRDTADPGKFELIMGERRWRATQAAGLDVIPAIIRDTDDGDLLRDALLENLHRAALNPLEEAAAYQQLLEDFGCTHEELSARIARSRPQISNTLRLLKLPPLVQRRVAAGVLSAGHARALLRLDDPAAMERLAQRIVAEGLSVRATEEITALGGVPEPIAKRAPRAGTRVEAIDDLAGRLADRFDTRVRIALGKRKGRITLEFASVDDLNRILGVMAPGEDGLFSAK